MVLLLLTASSLAGAAPGPGSLPFGPGEQLLYQVRFLGVSLGQARVTVGWPTERAKTTVWPLVCHGQTTSVAALFRLNDRFTSFLDPLTLRPTGHEYLADQTGFRRKDRFEYDRTAGLVLGTRVSPTQAPEEVSLEVDPLASDLAAATFRLRTLSLRPGEHLELPIFTGRRSYTALVDVLAQEAVATPLGEHQALKLSITTSFSGRAATRGALTAWFTADERRLPLKAEAEFSIGHVVAELSGYEPGSRAGEAR